MSLILTFIGSSSDGSESDNLHDDDLLCEQRRGETAERQLGMDDVQRQKRFGGKGGLSKFTFPTIVFGLQ